MTKNVGKYGEDEAARFLEGRGLVILERNYHSKHGEIDIIAKKDKYIIFIEVKTRKYKSISKPAEAVDDKKQRKILKTAMVYLQLHKYIDLQPRFDVIEVFYETDEFNKKIMTINYIENAFEMEEDFEDF